MSFLLLMPFSSASANSDTEYEKALKYYHRGKYKEAVSLFRDYVQKRPDPSAYYYLGYASYKLGKYGEATGYFQQAFLIDPDFSLGEMPPAENLEKEKKQDSGPVGKTPQKQIPKPKKR